MVRLTKHVFFVANHIVLETFSQKVFEGICDLFNGLCKTAEAASRQSLKNSKSCFLEKGSFGHHTIYLLKQNLAYSLNAVSASFYADFYSCKHLH